MLPLCLESQMKTINAELAEVTSYFLGLVQSLNNMWFSCCLAIRHWFTKGYRKNTLITNYLVPEVRCACLMGNLFTLNLIYSYVIVTPDRIVCYFSCSFFDFLRVSSIVNLKTSLKIKPLLSILFQVCFYRIPIVFVFP